MGSPWSNATSRLPIVRTARSGSGRDTTWARSCKGGTQAVAPVAGQR